jgi:hypothetical protein
MLFLFSKFYLQKRFVEDRNFFYAYALAKVASPFPGTINAMPNINSEIPVASEDVAQPAYTESPKPTKQVTNPKAIANKPKYARIDLAVVPFTRSPPEK